MKEFLRALEHQKRLLEKSCETCAIKEKELNHLEEQINQTVPVFVQQVVFRISTIISHTGQ